MDKGLGNESSSSISSHFSPAPINTNTNTDMILKQLNKNSHKIAKPFRKPIPLPNPTLAAAPDVDPNPHNPALGQGPPQSQQPPVYNINKNDFRDVVQKLTGSPAHDRLPPPPLTHPRPPSSRLQRIRPPPLSQIANLPGQILTRPHFAPHLPPLPAVHAAAESPISAYMRFIQNPSFSAAPWSGNEFPHRPPESPVSSYLRSLQNPDGSISDPPQHPPTQQPPASSAPPLSPVPFGCIPSPRSPYGMMARGFPFSPMAQLGLPQQLPPLSPTPPVSSPGLKGV